VGCADGGMLTIADQDGYHEVRVFQFLKESLVRTRAPLEGRVIECKQPVRRKKPVCACVAGASALGW
jgi:hypothetical protein